MSVVDRHTWRGHNYIGHHDSAEELALTISEYWRERGHTVQVLVEKGPTGKAAQVFAIRSDMKQGMPIGARSLSLATE